MSVTPQATPQAAPPKKLQVFRSLGKALGLSFLGGCTYAYFNDEGVWRYLIVAGSIAPMWADYTYTGFRTKDKSEEEVKAAFKAYHEKWADEPLRVCLKLRGFYVKVRLEEYTFVPLLPFAPMLTLLTSTHLSPPPADPADWAGHEWPA